MPKANKITVGVTKKQLKELRMLLKRQEDGLMKLEDVTKHLMLTDNELWEVLYEILGDGLYSNKGDYTTVIKK